MELRELCKNSAWVEFYDLYGLKLYYDRGNKHVYAVTEEVTGCFEIVEHGSESPFYPEMCEAYLMFLKKQEREINSRAKKTGVKMKKGTHNERRNS